jgi:SAM-dependent methyltransferase
MAGRDYDELAWCYDRYWGPRFHDAARPVLEHLLYRRLAPGDRILELCCGSGHLTEELVARGYTVTGVDNSIEMLRYARRRAPAADLVCADVAACPLVGGEFAAAVSTFDSLNHLASADALQSAFACAARALRRGGLFVFDINTAAAYRSEWTKSSAIVDDDAALFVRGGFDEATQRGRTLVTMFRFAGAWRRTDVEIVQRCYDADDLADRLVTAGFRDAAVSTAAALGMAGDMACGRAFLTATK